MNKLTETEKAYMAGLLDGEGCVGINKEKSRASAYPFTFAIRVIITNTDYNVICWLKEKTGIGCAYECKKGFKENWKFVHRWQIVSNEAREFLQIIYPYARIKKEIIDLVLGLERPEKKGKRYGKRTEKEYENQKETFNKAKEKNKRGKSITE